MNPEGKQRPLGVTVLEDKIVQRALVEVLNGIYETDFLGFWYGFGPGRSSHEALNALMAGIMTRKVIWVLDADIRGYFDSIDHEGLVKFVQHRVKDKRVIRHIRKWMPAGVLDQGIKTLPEEGVPQGGSLCPLVANSYAAENRAKRGQGKPETFDFLGFTHSCGRTRNGQFVVNRRTMGKRRQGKLKELKAELRPRLHHPIPEVGQWLCRVLRGHYRYYGVPGNYDKMGAFLYHVSQLGHKTLQRRSQRSSLNWGRMNRLLSRWLPSPRIYHPYPDLSRYVITQGRSPVR